MSKVDEIKKVEDAMPLLLLELSKFQQAAESAKKEGNNKHFNSSYSELSDVTAAIKEGSKGLLLSYRHQIEGDTLTTYVAYSDGVNYAQLSSWLSVDAKGGSNVMQAKGSAITYAKRYTLQGLYGLASEDDDGNSCAGATFERKPPPPPVFTLESFEKSKAKIEAKFKADDMTDPVEVAKTFVGKVVDQGFEVPKEVEIAVAKFCHDMMEKYFDGPIDFDGKVL